MQQCVVNQNAHVNIIQQT